MKRNYRGLLLLLFLLISGMQFAAEPFQLRFPDLSQGWFPSGAVVYVPGGKAPDKQTEDRAPEKRVMRLEVRLDKEAASEVPMEALTLSVDNRYPKFVRAKNAEGHLLIVTTREPLGLLVTDEPKIEATANGRHPYKGEWTIERWNNTYIQSTLVGRQNNAIGIELKQPQEGVVSPNTHSGMAQFTGKISGCDCRLTIAGQEVRRQPGEAGFQFDTQVPIAPGAKEVVVSASDETGAVTTLYLQVQWPSGH